MNTNIKISIYDSSIVVPNTGASTNADPGHVAILGCGALAGVIIIFSLFVLMKRHHKNHFSIDGKRKLGFKTTIGFSAVLLIGLGIVCNNNLDLISPANNTSATISPESLTVTAEDVNLELPIDKDNTTAYQSVANKVTVSTPGASGYVLKAYATGADLENSEDNTKKISAVEGVNEALTDNTWGFTLSKPEDESSAVWNAMPTTETEAMVLNSTESSAEGAETIVYYGAYVTNDLPYGDYEGVSINYIAVSNLTINDLAYMQDFVSLSEEDRASVDRSIEEDKQYQLKDSRDNKSYYISKLKDGNIWMTQNLDFDLSNTTQLTSIDTDLNESGSGAYVNGYSKDSSGIIHWQPTRSTASNVNTSTGKINGWTQSNNTASSADPDAGDINSQWYTTSDSFSSSLCRVNNNNQTCNYLNANNTVAPNYFQKSPFTEGFNTDDAHSKIGNYYNYPAAIASNSASNLTSSTYNDVDNSPKNSICPKGWRLPTISSVASRDEFTELNNIYNSGSTTDGYSLLGGPIYMTRSGYILGGDGTLYDAGYTGGYWSSTVKNTYDAYVLDIRSSFVGTASGYNKLNGWSVRCVLNH